MDWREVRGLVEVGESATVEFKRGVADLSAVGKALCAFANTLGGTLILGVSNDRRIIGVEQDPESVRERLTSFLQNGCSQPVAASMGRHESPEGWVHWLEAPPQRGFEPMRYSGRVWVRRGSASVEPSPAELGDLYNTFGYILTEERAIQDATAAHIDLEAFDGYLRRLGFDTVAEPQPASEDDLRNRSVLVDLGGELRATLYGVLAFGKQPQRYPQTRDFRIECVAYAGEDRASEVLQSAAGTGRLNEQVERAVGWFLGLGRFEDFRRLVREDRHLLPRAAIREALVNAVIHRDYAIIGSMSFLEVFSDRVEVTSPGALPNHMTVEQVRAGANPRSRNGSMAHFMSAMGYMEKRGRGWLIMRRVMLAFNRTEPALTNDRENRFVKVGFSLG